MCRLFVVIATIGTIVWSGTALAIVDQSSISVNNGGNELDGTTVSLTTKIGTGNPSTPPRKTVTQPTRSGTQGQTTSDAATQRAFGSALGLGLGIGLHGGFGRGDDHGTLRGGDRGTLRGGDRGTLRGGDRGF
jgi:hypothetical protein